MGTGTILLIVGGVLLLLGLGTCAAGAIWVGHRAKEFKENIADGGLVLVAPPEVVTELSDPKKDYVGAWTSESEKSTLEIHSDGSFKLVQDERGTKETLSAPIAAFIGNDLEIRFGLSFKIAVAEPPHRANNRWEMTLRGIPFHRY